MNRVIKLLRPRVWILLILSIAFALRVKDLVFQSLWLDELHLMIEADPSLPWKDLFKFLEFSDLQPPVYFIIERLAFSMFGYNEFVARMVTAIAGTLSVGAMYLLGKEILNKRLGLFCALLTCFNFYNIHYSQDARPYIFSFLFAALSFSFFLRVIKKPDVRNGLLYSFWTLIFLYTHYFSLFAVSAQAVIALIFLFQEKGAERKAMVRSFIMNGLIIVVGYSFWVPVIMRIKQSEQTWIPVPANDFLQNYFKEYFGNDDLLQPLLMLMVVVFFVRIASISGKEAFTKLKDHPLLRCFTIVFFWIFICYLIPYVRSLMSVPLLYPRYTIIVLPAYILILAYSFELFKVPVVRYGMLSVVLCISLINLVVVKEYYSKAHKTQFREMTEFLVAKNTSNFPVINEQTQWQQAYYMKKLKAKGEQWLGRKEALMDSIRLKTSGKYNVSGFWIVGAHGDKKPDSLAMQSINSQYELAVQKDFFDAWVMLFLERRN